MPVIEITTHINAPVERVFDLSRSVDLHEASTAHTGERAIAGVTSGLMTLGQEVTWRAQHFGIRLQLTSRITAFERPVYFRDSLVRGPFCRFDHDHFFTPCGEVMVMRDLFDFQSPFAIFGRIANWLFLTQYLRRLLMIRNAAIKNAAESEDWRHYLLRTNAEP